MEQSKTLTNPSGSLSPFPPHRRRRLKSDTLSTFIRILSLGPSPHPQRVSASNEMEQTTEVCGDANGTTNMESEILSTNGDASWSKVTHVAESVHGNRMETTNMESEILSTNGDVSCSKLTYVDESAHEDRIETTNKGPEMLSANGDASCLEVTNMAAPVHEDKMETTNMEPEILPTNGDASCSKFTYVEESVHEDRMETTNTGPAMLSANSDASCLEVTNMGAPVHEDIMETTIMEPEILSTNGDASCSKFTNVSDSVHKDRMEATNMESEILSTHGDSSCLKVINVAGSVHEDRMETKEFDCGSRTKKELGQETCFETANFVGETNRGSSVVSLTTIDEPQNTQVGVGPSLEDSEIVTHTDVDKEYQSCKFTEGFHLSLDMDELAKSPIVGDNAEERSLVMESNELHRLNLENLMNSPICVAGDEEVEEGEISGDFVIDDEFIDFLFEEDQTSEPIINRERITYQNKKGAIEGVNEDDKELGITVNEFGKGLELNLRERDVSEIEMKYGKMIQEVVGNQKQTDRANEEEFNHSGMPGKVLEGSGTANQSHLFFDVDAGVMKKRKRGPGTQEKKKKNERIRRAEKNRQLGVKRLKIQPVVKPKKIEYCRHYIRGRCQEGDMCKFSHDMIPLTKSTPCGHFARNSCMKGDDCPYDHQLSKYPCNFFVSNGFCFRGTGCMFSHEVQRKESSPSSVDASNTEVKSSSLSWVTNPEKKISSSYSIQKVDPKSGSSGISSSKNAEQKVAEIKLGAAAPAPTGISRLLFGKSSLVPESKLVQAGKSSKADGNVNVNLSVVASVQNMVSNLLGTSKVAGPSEQKGLSFLSSVKAPTHYICMDKNRQVTSPPKQDESLKITNHTGESNGDLVPNLSEMPKRTPSMQPRGINFLSFGKAPVNNSSNMMTVTPNADNGASSSAHERERVPNLADQLDKGASSSALKSLLSNRPSSAQRALQSTLAFAAKFESRIKVDHPVS